MITIQCYTVTVDSIVHWYLNLSDSDFLRGIINYQVNKAEHTTYGNSLRSYQWSSQTIWEFSEQDSHPINYPPDLTHANQIE